MWPICGTPGEIAFVSEYTTLQMALLNCKMLYEETVSVEMTSSYDDDDDDDLASVLVTGFYVLYIHL